MSTNKISWTSSAYPNYENYEKRLNTYFERFWPVSIRQNGMMMAKAGFFYRGFGDIVTCSFCGVSLHKWLQNDDPVAEHRKFNENCKFIRLLQDVNIPRDSRKKYSSMILYRLYNPFFQILKVPFTHIFIQIAVADYFLILVGIIAKYV